MKVKDIMTEPVQYCAPESNLAAVAKEMWDSDCGVLPIVNHAGEVEGVITDRDICMAVATKGRVASDITVWETSSGSLYACSPEDPIHHAMTLMQEHKVRRLPVLDDNRVLRGMISLNDIVLNVSGQKGKKVAEPTIEDVFQCFRAISEHRTLHDPEVITVG